jgi:hypothetical protein
MKNIKFVLLNSLCLIVADSILRYLQWIIFRDHGEYWYVTLALMFLSWSIALFQWVFLLISVVFLLIRRKVESESIAGGVALGFFICAPYYFVYWFFDEFALNVLRQAVVNCIGGGFVMEILYRRMFPAQETSDSL